MKKIRFFTAICFSIIFAFIPPCESAKNIELSDEDIEFLDMVQREAFKFFWKEANPKNGLIKDGNRSKACSIASVGFGLTSLCVAESRGWITYDEAYERVLTTLKTFHKDPSNPDDFVAEGKYGLFFHFLDMNTGKWSDNADCVSTVDTADLIAGVITCMEYFKGTEIEEIGDEIVRACQWDKFMFDNSGKKQNFISMGYVPPGEKSTWTDVTGFLGRYYGYSDNSFLIYILGIGSPAYPIDVSSWYTGQATYKWQKYNGNKILVAHPPGLAFHYYPHCWVALKNKKDQVVDYYKNTLLAVLAQQDYCKNSENYENSLWGLSSCISKHGYGVYGAPLGAINEDGTITPHAIAGAIDFTPQKSIDTLKYLYDNYKAKVWRQYGFTDSLNPKNHWFCREYLGLDQGPIVIMIENFRTGLVWKHFMRNKYIKEAMKKIGFVGIIENFETGSLGQTYSRYRLVPGRNAKSSLNKNISMEGNQSLKIKPKKKGSIILSIKPDLTDFSNFEYISLWSRNTKNIEVKLKDENNNICTITAPGTLESAGWKRYFFPLGKAENISLDSIKKLSIYLTPESRNFKKSIYLDGIFLTYSAVDINPSVINNLKASIIESSGVCKLTFEKPENALMYDIRYSDRPILNQDDYEKQKRLGDMHFASVDSKQENKYTLFPEKGTYYIAVQAIDKMLQRSDIVSCGPVILDKGPQDNFLDGFEREELETELFDWAAFSDSIKLEISEEQALKGNKSLKVVYNKTGDWDHILMEFKKPLNVKPFRYLKINVYGEETIIAKLYVNKDTQEDIDKISSIKKDQWNKLTFDMWKISEHKLNKENINKIIFFVAPGKKKSGTVYFDEIRLDNIP